MHIHKERLNMSLFFKKSPNSLSRNNSLVKRLPVNILANTLLFLCVFIGINTYAMGDAPAPAKTNNATTTNETTTAPSKERSISSTQEEEYKEGTHYTKVGEILYHPMEKVDIIEFFSYGCPHCFHIEPVMRHWLETSATYTSFVRMPAYWNPFFELMAQAYYTAEILKAEDKIHEPLFKAIHELKQNLQTRNSVKAFFVAQGVTEADFEKTFDSFAVNQKMKMAADQFKKYKLKSVPSFVVGGVYATSITQAGSPEALTKVLNHLAKKLHQAD